MRLASLAFFVALAVAAPAAAQIDLRASALRVELAVRVTHGVSMEIDRVFGGQLASWAGASLSFGGERFSGTLAYDGGVGVMTRDRAAHTVSLRAGYDLAGAERRTRVTLSLGPLMRFGRIGTTECVASCTEAARETIAESQGVLPMAAGGVLALDALHPFDAWLVGLSIEVRGAGPIEPRAVGSIEISLGLRVAVDLARL